MKTAMAGINNSYAYKKSPREKTPNLPLKANNRQVGSSFHGGRDAHSITNQDNTHVFVHHT
jgi:hypothetical protein